MTSYFEKTDPPKPDFNNYNNLEKFLYGKDNSFILNEEKRQSNLYPNKTQMIYSNYRSTELREDFSEKSIFNKIFALDCEMVHFSFFLKRLRKLD